MSFTIGENYLLKAIEAYDFDMNECIEALNYALSYEEENVEAWVLRGKVMLYYIKDYAAAEESFVQALTINPTHSEAFIEFIWLRINEARLEAAQSLLSKALDIVCKDFALFYRLQAVLFEYNNHYAEAIEKLEQALDKTYNCSFQCFLEDEIKRIKKKKKRSQKRKKKKPVLVKHYTSNYLLR